MRGVLRVLDHLLWTPCAIAFIWCVILVLYTWLVS